VLDMLIWVRLLLRLMALGCFLVAAALYLLVAHHAHLTCDRAAATCVLEETRPLRDVRVQTFPLSDVLDAGCQSAEWTASPQASTILKQARRPFNAGESGLWMSVGSTEGIPKYRVVLLTRSGIIPVTPHFVRDCAERDAITAVLDGRAAHGELDLGRWRDGLAVTLLPAGMGLALLVWAGRVTRSRDNRPSDKR
jgi:hypothetical protein